MANWASIGKTLGWIFAPKVMSNVEQYNARKESQKLENLYKSMMTEKGQWDLEQSKKEEARLSQPATLPVSEVKSIPSGGIGKLPSGEWPQTDYPTTIREELGVKQVPTGMTWRALKDMPQPLLTNLYKQMTGEKDPYELAKIQKIQFDIKQTEEETARKEKETKRQLEPIRRPSRAGVDYETGTTFPVVGEATGVTRGMLEKSPEQFLKYLPDEVIKGMGLTRPPETEKSLQSITEDIGDKVRFGTFSPKTAEKQFGPWQPKATTDPEAPKRRQATALRQTMATELFTMMRRWNMLREGMDLSKLSIESPESIMALMLSSASAISPEKRPQFNKEFEDIKNKYQPRIDELLGIKATPETIQPEVTMGLGDDYFAILEETRKKIQSDPEKYDKTIKVFEQETGRKYPWAKPEAKKGLISRIGSAVGDAIRKPGFGMPETPATTQKMDEGLIPSSWQRRIGGIRKPGFGMPETPATTQKMDVGSETYRQELEDAVEAAKKGAPLNKVNELFKQRTGWDLPR